VGRIVAERPHITKGKFWASHSAQNGEIHRIFNRLKKYMKAFLLVVCSSLLVWPAFAQPICNDTEIKSNFTRAQNPKEYHYYLTETKVCSGTQNPNCNQTNVFLALLRNVSLAAPTDAQTPVMNCGVYNVKYPDLPVVGLGGPIRIAINYRNQSITNHTKSGHSFHPGKVVRKIVQHGSDIYIQSEGSGIGGYKTINDTDGLMAFFWGRIDQRLVEAFEKSPVVNPQKFTASCGFTWTPWSNVSMADKAAMKKIMVPDPEGGYIGSLFQYITDQVKEGEKIQVARHDFFDKKEPGYIISIEYPNPRVGTIGRVEVYEDLGKLYLFPPVNIINSLCAIRPASDNKGVIGEDGRQEFLSNNSISFDRSYEKFLTETKQIPAKSAPTANKNTGRLGANTAEELAILLLKCLKTNDKATFMRCQHPDDTVETDEVSSRKFDRHRENLTSNGITNWASVQYSRLTYPLRPTGGEKVDPNQTIPMSTVEFTYKNGEFIGGVHMGTFKFYEGKWLVWFSGYPEDDRVYRPMR
jgi:hypothetical protein